MKKIVVILLLAFPFIVLCQDEQLNEGRNINNSLSILSGINELHYRDEYLSPYNYSAVMFTAASTYTLRTGPYYHSINAFFSTGHPSSEQQTRDVTEYAGNLSYLISLMVLNTTIFDNSFQLLPGAGISSFFTSTNFDASDDQYDYTFYDRSWYWSHSLSLSLSGVYALSGNSSISLQAAFPLFSLISRPENSHNFNDKNAKVIDNFFTAAGQGRSEFLWNDLVLLLEAGYARPISDHFDFRVLYRFSYGSSDRPLPLKMYMNNFLAGINWKF